MNIIAVDDEQYALMSLEKAIKQALPDCNIIGFDISVDALDYARKFAVDVAFLDINMPEINGLELAEKMIAVNEKTNIVFVTGYSEHGIDAVNIHASGYLLKPITSESIIKAMKNLRNPFEPPKMIVRGPLKLDIVAGKAFIDDVDMGLSRKEFSILLLLVNNEGKELNLEAIYNNIWGQQIIDDHNAVQRTISRLRKKLEDKSRHTIRSIYGKGYIFEPKVNKASE